MFIYVCQSYLDQNAVAWNYMQKRKDIEALMGVVESLRGLHVSGLEMGLTQMWCTLWCYVTPKLQI